MEFQGNRVFNVEGKYIDTPTNDEFVTIWRNKLDNKYYGRRANGTDELIGGSPGSGIEVFVNQINNVFDLQEVPTSYNTCFILLQPGKYVFDVVCNFRCLTNAFYTLGAFYNTDNSQNSSPGDVEISSRSYQHTDIANGVRASTSIMSGTIDIASPFSFKSLFSIDSVPTLSDEVTNITMRAIKIG